LDRHPQSHTMMNWSQLSQSLWVQMHGNLFSQKTAFRPILKLCSLQLQSSCVKCKLIVKMIIN
jgi:hypothetical protein